MTEIPVKKQPEPEFSRRQLWFIGFPVVVAFLFIIFLVLVLVVPRTSAEISIMSDIILICFTLLPIMLCVAPFYLLFMAGAFGLNGVINSTENLLLKTKAASETMLNKTTETAETINRRSIGINTRFAFLDRIFKEKSDHERQSDHEE